MTYWKLHLRRVLSALSQTIVGSLANVDDIVLLTCIVCHTQRYEECSPSAIIMHRNFVCIIMPANVIFFLQIADICRHILWNSRFVLTIILLSCRIVLSSWSSSDHTSIRQCCWHQHKALWFYRPNEHRLFTSWCSSQYGCVLWFLSSYKIDEISIILGGRVCIKFGICCIKPIVISCHWLVTAYLCLWWN